MFHGYITLEETKFWTVYATNSVISRENWKACTELWDLPLSLTWATLESEMVNNSKCKTMRNKPWYPVTVFLDQVYWEYHGWSRSPAHSFLSLLPVHEKLHKHSVNYSLKEEPVGNNRLSFRKCKSCVYNCDDLLYIILHLAVRIIIRFSYIHNFNTKCLDKINSMFVILAG